LREGLQVGAALRRSWLPRIAVQAQRVAAFAVGAAVPIVAGRVLGAARPAELAATLLAAALGIAVSLRGQTRFHINGLRYGLLLVGVAAIAVEVLG
jgi:hypothetical protein